MAEAIVPNPSPSPIDKLLESTRQLRALTLALTGHGLDGFLVLDDDDQGEIMHMLAGLAGRANVAANEVNLLLEGRAHD
jgi:hypothetical protein